MPPRAILLLAMLRLAAASDPPKRWGAAVAVLPSPPTLVVQGGKVESEGQTYNSAPNNADTYIVPLNASFPADNPPYEKLTPKSPGPSYSWHCLAPLYAYQDKWTMLSFGGDGGWSEPKPGGTDSAWLVDLNPTDGSVNYTQQPAGWANEPSRRVEHSCAAPSGGGKVYITGGQADDGSTEHEDVWEFDPDPMKFSKIASLPKKLYGHSSVLLDNGTLLVFGGVDGDSQMLNSLNTVYTLNTTANQPQWESVNVPGNAPEGRRGAAATLIGNQNVLLFGGSNTNRTSVFGDAWVLNPRTLQWSQVMNDQTGPGARFDAVVAYVGNGQVAIVGGYNAEGPVAGGFNVLNVVTSSMSDESGQANAGAGSGGGTGAGAEGGAGAGAVGANGVTGTGAAFGTASAVASFLPNGQGSDGSSAAGQNGVGGTGAAAGSTQTGSLPVATQASSFTTGTPIATSINTRPTGPTSTGGPGPTPVPHADSSSDGSRRAAIIGGIVASVAVVFIALILFFWCSRRRRDRKYREELAQRRMAKEGDAEAWGAHITPPTTPTAPVPPPKSRFGGMAALGAGVGAGVGAVAATIRKVSGGRNPEYQAVATDEKSAAAAAAAAGGPPRRRSTRYIGQRMRLVGHSDGHDPFSDQYSEDLPFEGDSTARTSAFGPGIASTEVGMRQRQVSNEHSPIPEEDEEIPIGGRWATANLILCDSRSDTDPIPTSPTRMSRASFLASEDDFNLLAPIPRRPMSEGALLSEVPSRESGISGASGGSSMADLANASLETGSLVPLENDAPVLWDMANKAPVHGPPVDFHPFSSTTSDTSELVPPALLLRLAEHTESKSSSVNSKHRSVAPAIAEPRGIGSEHGEIDETSFRDSRSSRGTEGLDISHAAYAVQPTSAGRHTFGTLGPKSPYYYSREEDPDATPLASQQARFEDNNTDFGLDDLIPDFGSTPSSLIRLKVPSVLERGGSDSTVDSALTWSSLGTGVTSGVARSGSTVGTFVTAPRSEVNGSEVSTASTVGTWTTAPPQAPPEIEEELAELREASLATPLATSQALARVDTDPELACVETPRVISTAVMETPRIVSTAAVVNAPRVVSTAAVVNAPRVVSTAAVVETPRVASETTASGSTDLQRSSSGSSTMAVVGSQPSERERALNRSLEGIDMPSRMSEFKSPPPSPAPPQPPSPEERQPWPQFETKCRPSPDPSIFAPVFPDIRDPFQDAHEERVLPGSYFTSDVEDLLPPPPAPPAGPPPPPPTNRRSIAGMAGLGRQFRPVREAIDSINRRGAGLPSRFSSGSGKDFTPSPTKASPKVASAGVSPAKAASPTPTKGKEREEFHLRPTYRASPQQGPSKSPVSFRTAPSSGHSDSDK